MSRLRIAALALAMLLTVVISDASAISRTSRSLNYLQVFTGYAKPVGEVEFFNLSEPSPDFDTEDLYAGTYFIGVGLGQVRAGRMNWSLDFRYTKLELDDRIDRFLTGTGGLDHNAYDVDLNINYYLTDMAQTDFSPYVGLGVTAGVMTAGWDDDLYDNESELKAMAGINFGFDLRLAQNSDGSQISFVSLNRYDILASDERPRYLNIGVALRYYVRP